VSRVSIVSCHESELDLDIPVLIEALAAEGVDATLTVWNDPSVQWDQFALNVIRSTWDYANQRDAFVAWAASTPNLMNPVDVIRYSSDKHYFADLTARGYTTVPSAFFDVGAAPSFPTGPFVVKPCVGAGSIDADRYAAGDEVRALAHVESLHVRGRDVVVQPYIDSVDDQGETALIYIDGKFSHAMRKAAMLNVANEERDALFRREQMTRITPDPAALELGDRVMADPQFSSLLYGRVDVVETFEGWRIMELELVEPSLFLTYAPETATALAQAIAHRLA
jgi:glutathione synthase/RimK-type ligase-like ATP-grasp enzyme